MCLDIGINFMNKWTGHRVVGVGVKVNDGKWMMKGWM